MALTERERDEVKELAELEVRRYFDTYLKDVFPTQVGQIVRLHNLSPAAHGGVERKVNRAIWLITGASALGGGLSAGVMKLIALFASGS